MGEPVYRRVVVKLSGEALAGSEGFGIAQPTIEPGRVRKNPSAVHIERRRVGDAGRSGQIGAVLVAVLRMFDDDQSEDPLTCEVDLDHDQHHVER